MRLVTGEFQAQPSFAHMIADNAHREVERQERKKGHEGLEAIDPIVLDPSAVLSAAPALADEAFTNVAVARANVDAARDSDRVVIATFDPQVLR